MAKRKRTMSSARAALTASKASGTEYQTLATASNPSPTSPPGSPTKEFCRKNNQMNVIVACYRDATKTWRP
jgi:hypothetical protein